MHGVDDAFLLYPLKCLPYPLTEQLISLPNPHGIPIHLQTETGQECGGQHGGTRFRLQSPRGCRSAGTRQSPRLKQKENSLNKDGFKF